MELTEWAKHYIKFKDCMKRQIVDLSVTGNTIIVQEKTKTIKYVTNDTLADLIPNIPQEQVVLVVLNSAENFETLHTQWNVLHEYPQLTIWFVHPSSNQLWLIHPHTHHKITEQDVLVEGLKTLHESISQV